VLQLRLLEEALGGLLVNDGKRVELLEEALAHLIVLVLEELVEGAASSAGELLSFRQIRLHEAVKENGALL